ncbi:hypothetical protein B7486_08600 [cyanobacterium TDX16]|nr:hypothetical protein B7486_08600 [cyanobacterium TDX16]
MAKGESKSYAPAEHEQRIFDAWIKAGHFHPSPDERGPDQRFSMVIPPPNVTGALHLGHALNNTLQDILIRRKRMQGANTFWLVGTDHAGIATQATVEKTIRKDEGLSRHQLGREELVKRIWQWKEKFGGRIVEQLKLMGCSCDYERERFTLDEGCAKAVRETFFKMFRDGLIYRGKRLVNWDTQLQTAVADDEVYHEQVKGHFYHFKYPIKDAKSGEPTHVHIATTRPETMLADTAVAVHPEPNAALEVAETQLQVKLREASEKEKPAIHAQLEDIADRKTNLLPTLMKLRDMAKTGRMVLLPLVDREIPLVCDEWADPSLGTGCVKITPGHDFNDYEVGQRCKLDVINIMTPDGRVSEHGGQYKDMKLADARKKVVADLEALALVEKIEDRQIELAHSDRSNSPIEPYLSDQWFVKMGDLPPDHAAKIKDLHGATGLAQLAIDAVKSGKVKFHPERYAKTYIDWLSEKRDWCISRQLWWGHRIPVWSTVVREAAPGAVAVGGMNSFARVQAVVSKLVDDYACHMEWGIPGRTGTFFICFREEPSASVRSQIEAVEFAQDPDVLDTWFSSALWPHSTLGWPDAESNENLLNYYYPTSVLSTAREIITLWVARMVITGLYNVGKIPFTDVVIHPVIQDGQGRKMSKTLGNGVDPVDIIEEYGADALRYTLAELATETQDIRLPVKPKKLPDGRSINVSEKFEKGRNFCNKLWQASTGFVIPNLDGYAPQQLDPAKLGFVDRWILSRLAACVEQVNESLDRFRFSEAMGAVYRFMWDEYCSWYIEMTKPRLAGSERAAAQQVMVYVLDQLLRLLQPIVPFVSEAIWGQLNRAAPDRGLRAAAKSEATLIVAKWSDANGDLRDKAVESKMEAVQEVIRAVRDMRAVVNDYRGKAKEPSLRTLPKIVVQCDASVSSMLTGFRDFIIPLAGCDAMDIGAGASKPDGSMSRVCGMVQVYAPVAGLVDLAEVKKTDEAKLTELRGVLSRESARLGNADFVARADPSVVEAAKARAADLSSQIEMLERHLADLE